MNTVDTLFVLICAAMVLLMTPALAVFYAGLCRKKSGVDIMIQVWICLAVVGLLWTVIGSHWPLGQIRLAVCWEVRTFSCSRAWDWRSIPPTAPAFPSLPTFFSKRLMLSSPLP